MKFSVLLILQLLNHGHSRTGQPENVQTLKVVAVQKKPFMYKEGNEKFSRGIEFELIKSIATKENLNCSVEVFNSTTQIDEPALKYTEIEKYCNQNIN